GRGRDARARAHLAGRARARRERGSPPPPPPRAQAAPAHDPLRRAPKGAPQGRRRRSVPRSMTPVDDRLLALLIERSFARRRVVLASGAESDFFIDCKQTVLLAEGHARVGEAMLAALTTLPEAPVAVAG